MMTTQICFASLLLALTAPAILALTDQTPADYTNHQLIRIFPKRSAHLTKLRFLENELEMDYWNEPMADLRPVLTLVRPDNSQKFLGALNQSGIGYEVTENNIQKVIDAEKEENDNNRRLFRALFDYEQTYHTYNEIVSELSRITKNNTKARYASLGQSYEKRQIPVVYISDGETHPKQSVVIECGIHAREWLSTSTCLWIMNDLLTNQANDALIKKHEFIIIPSLNPDGYVYTHNGYGRMWRKNRSPQKNGQIGVDLNRNFDSAFGTVGISQSSSSESYCGSNAFSEVESQLFKKFIESKKGSIAAYFAIHAFSQLWMYPYGYTNNPSPNAQTLERLSTLAVNAIRKTNGLTFKKGSIAKTIYLASGSSIDWAYEKAGVKASFALELRDTGRYGFIMPPQYIRPAAEETWNGIKAVVNGLQRYKL